MPCRIGTRRKWQGRVMLEAHSAAAFYFATLTYDDEHVPIQDGQQILYPPDLKKFIRNCNSTAGAFRYYAIGEYGDSSFRPHYHLAIFTDKFFQPKLIDGIWPGGYTSVRLGNEERASYIAGYCTKKMMKDDDRRLQGRPPEFMRQSTRPAIGGAGMSWLQSLYESHKGAKWIAKKGDIETQFTIGGTEYPMDYFTAQKLRLRLGIPLTYSARVKMNPNAEREEILMPDSDELTLRKMGVKQYGTTQKQKRLRSETVHI